MFLKTKATTLKDNWRLIRLGMKVAAKARPRPGQKPLIIFNATARLSGLSQNAAFAMLSGMGLHLAGLPVVYFACKAGLSRCVLGTNGDDHTQPPPCNACLNWARRVFAHAPVVWFDFRADARLQAALEGLDLEALSRFEYPLGEDDETCPLGELVLPSLRWALRRYHLSNDEATRFLMRQYILSAYRVVEAFTAVLKRLDPQAVVIFNGVMYPEAAARWVALRLGYRVITHEVGFGPFSAFFCDGQATAYPIHIPPDFELSPQQNAELDRLLEKRFQGQFTMAGIRFWPEMRGLDEAFLSRAQEFRQIVPVFTNVIYDTSQIHANKVFPHMFAWLDAILELIKVHPETLFVIRAHPDEMRPGTRKQSRESVAAWVRQHAVQTLPNVIFVDSHEYLSSYQLIQRSKFVMVYNSSIGLEAAAMGVAVLCGGKARYTQYPIVYFAETPQAYCQQAEVFLNMTVQEAKCTAIPAPQEFVRNARRFLYYQYFRVSLPFDSYLESAGRPGYVRLRSFHLDELHPERSPAINVILNGIINHAPFVLSEAE